MTKRYAIIGSGRQGTSAGYDIARFGNAEQILMIDVDEVQAVEAAGRVNRLIGAEIARSVMLDVENREALMNSLKENKIDAFLSATPYRFNLMLTQTAIATGVGMTDLGGNSDVIQGQRKLSSQAAEKGISIVPDCGMGPGMTTTLAMYAMELLDETEEILIWDCGLPYHPEEPWKYALTFDFNGLINEYHGDCLYIRNGEITQVPVLGEMEELEFPEPIGQLEGFTTAGGLTTAVETFEGKLQTLQNKTLRYPGHYDQLKLMQQLGLFEESEIQVAGTTVVPRKVLQTMWEPQIRADQTIEDFALIRALARGMKQGQRCEVQVDFLCDSDSATGFTAMEISTGWHAAIFTQAVARGEVAKGVIPIERAMTGQAFVREAEKRGFEFSVEIREEID
jgi:lysine 6-dehydrogenase